jgi:hypothetical protein
MSRPPLNEAPRANALTAETASRLRAAAVGLQHASVTVAKALERLCDDELTDGARENATGQLYVDLADVGVALAEFIEAVFPEQPAWDAHADESDPLLRVAPIRWHRQYGWERDGAD